MKKYKKFISIILAAAFVFSVSACSSSSTEEETTARQETTAESTADTAASGVDVDRTELSSTMVYSEVYNMVFTPEDYMGKTVKMNGTFSIYEGDDRNYYACLISDATACCSQGIEFVLDGDYTYPDDYPELGSEITVTGTFDTYTEGELTYCQLVDAVMQ